MPAIHRRWTTADVRCITRDDRAWPRYELIGGELLVTPAPRMAHQIASFELCLLLHTYLAREPLGVAVMSPSDLELHPGTITHGIEWEPRGRAPLVIDLPALFDRIEAQLRMFSR